MKEEKLTEEIKELNFTKEEEFKIKQTNELIEILEHLRITWQT